MDTHLIQPLIAVLISFFVAARAYRRQSLNFSGAVAGLAVMTLHIAVGYRYPDFTLLFFSLNPNGQNCNQVSFFLALNSPRYGAVLLVFFFTSSKLTKVGEDKKRRVDPEFKEGGQRNWY